MQHEDGPAFAHEGRFGGSEKYLHFACLAFCPVLFPSRKDPDLVTASSWPLRSYPEIRTKATGKHGGGWLEN
jgi:hypothetical protein